jgi:hypothetical protein
VPDGRDARVLARGDRRAALLGVHHHGPELEDEERLAAPAHAFLPEQHGPAVVELDEYGHDHEQRPQQQQTES